MAAPDALIPANGPVVGDRAAGTVQLILFGLIAAYVSLLLSSLAGGHWLFDRQGHGIPTDFVNIWSAGGLILAGNPAGVYDWATHKQAEVAALGADFPTYFGWPYPPPILFVAALVALLPYGAAFVAWTAVTLPLYAAVVRRIVGDNLGLFLACAFPGALWNATVGQNGFVTAALIGGTLLTLDRRPLIAGCCLGLLTYKPHFGILFPLVLVATGRWTVFWTAAAAAIAMAGLSVAAFGVDAWVAFVRSLSMTADATLNAGLTEWYKLQSLYGLARFAGLNGTAAWALQGALIALCAISLCLLWRSRVAEELKAAGLAIGALLATPYIYVYDLAALAIPVAFLVRLGRADGFLPGEPAALVIASAAVLAFPAANAPTGFAAMLIVALLVARRVLARPHPRPLAPRPA
jgi:arabinofuranan 3-O-arabinosyltransferase